MDVRNAELRILASVATMNSIPAILATLFSSLAVETFSIPPNAFASDNDLFFIFFRTSPFPL